MECGADAVECTCNAFECMAVYAHVHVLFHLSSFQLHLHAFGARAGAFGLHILALRYETACKGDLPEECEEEGDPMETYKCLKMVCQSMHKVESAELLYGTDFKKSVVPCRLNPLNLTCTCKGSGAFSTVHYDAF